MKARTSVWFAILAAAVAAAAARGAESGEFRVDARPSYGGRVGTGVEWVGEADGSALRQWDTTALPDGWTTLESGGGAAEVCVLNGPDVAGGRVAEKGPDPAGLARGKVQGVSEGEEGRDNGPDHGRAARVPGEGWGGGEEIYKKVSNAASRTRKDWMGVESTLKNMKTASRTRKSGRKADVQSGRGRPDREGAGTRQ